MFDLGVEYAVEKINPYHEDEWLDESFRAGYYFVMSTVYGIAAKQVLSAYCAGAGIPNLEVEEILHSEDETGTCDDFKPS